MIRNVVMGRLREASDDGAAADDRDRLGAALANIAALRYPGLIEHRIGLDAGLREGGWSFAITNDWADVAAYREYDDDPVHGRFRAEIGAVCDQLARVQIEG